MCEKVRETVLLFYFYFFVYHAHRKAAVSRTFCDKINKRTIIIKNKIKKKVRETETLRPCCARASSCGGKKKETETETETDKEKKKKETETETETEEEKKKRGKSDTNTKHKHKKNTSLQ